MVFDGVDKKLGGLIKANLHIAKLKVRDDWDHVQLIVGLNRTGKTEFAKLVSYYFDPTVNIDRWAYSAEQFEKIIDDTSLAKGSVIVWDESDDFTGHYNSEIIQVFKKKFKRIASWNFIILLITPTFFDMNKYFAVMRTDCLWHVYTTPTYDKEKDKFSSNRGTVMFYGRESKRQLYFKGKKDDWNMNAVRSDFYDSFGRVPDDYPIDNNLLVAKKDEAMRNMLKKEESDDSARLNRKKERTIDIGSFVDHLRVHYKIKLSTNEIASIFRINDRTVQRYLKDYNSMSNFSGISSKESDTLATQ